MLTEQDALALQAPLACFWHVSFVLCDLRRFSSIPWLDCLCAAAFYEMNGMYMSMVLRTNECCFYVRKAVVLGTDSLFWTRCYFFVVQYVKHLYRY